MSEYATENSILDQGKGNYLANLGYKGALYDTFKWNSAEQNVIRWFRDGALLEDEGGKFSGRFYNHFHNPLYSYNQWNDTGLTSAWPWVHSGKSAILWAVDDSSNDWRWGRVRDYYYKALTASADADRQANFAQTFRGLGQIIHLLQDMAQPAHVRNDPHPADDTGVAPGFEYWAKRADNKVVVADLMSKPIYPAVSLNTTVGGYSPITRFFDNDQFDGTNPSRTLSLGLAEYTNANFVSEDTIFKDFAYPRREDTVVFSESQNKTLNGFEVYRKYFEKVGGGEPVKHFTTASRLYAYLLDDPSPSLQGFDDRCYKDYADLLIPRAVGYSAALINYFFRGKLDMVADSGQYVIKNESAEAMSGAFRLYYDDKYDMRKQVPAAEWNLNIPANGQSSPVTFTAPSDAKEPGKYMLVFLGTHGAESGAVVGKEVTLQSKDGVIKIRLTGPDGGQIKRDIIFNVWAKRNDTGTLCKIAAAAWKYNDAANYWEVTVPSVSDAIEYNAAYNQYYTVTPVGGFDLAQGVYLDYLWKAAAVGVWPTTYMGVPTWYQPTYEEEVSRNLAQNPRLLGLKTGYKPNIQPIPGIEVLTIFPKDNYNNYSIQLVYDAAKKQINLAGGTRLVVAANDEGVYGLSQKGYSSMIIKVTPSALPATNYSFEFSINSGRLDKSKIIKSGSVWTQYPGKYRTDQRYLPASKLDLKQNRVLEDIIPYIYTEQTSDVSTLYMNQMQVSTIESNSNMEYSIRYFGDFYGALWRNLSGQGDPGLLSFHAKDYCWTITLEDSSYVLWDNVNGECGGSPGYSPLSWVPSGSIAWVDTDTGSFSLFPVNLILNKKFEFTPGTRTHYIAGNNSIPSTLTMSSGTKATNYSLQEQDNLIHKRLNGPNILLGD
jgi:hypothetical protein